MALYLLLCVINVTIAQESICVRVRIEIDQELTLERQGFEARMNLKNGGVADLKDVSVVVKFADQDKNPVVATSDPSNLAAKFFIKLTSSVVLPDTVAAGAEAKLRWLIVPAISAGGANPVGALYFVGAKLSYTLNGVLTTIDVDPDSIRVKPMPQLSLDYFLPFDVYGDDPFTPLIEAPIPFSLGVRVKNSGYGEAHNLKIESSQPRIIDNKQGLAVKFSIIGSEVDGLPATPSLLADFGTIGASRSGVGRWTMTSTLYGRFVEFSANFTHSDDLGGTLTSLITAVHTHTLIHDVLVDLPGRDNVRDFLALDLDTPRVYESENNDAAATDVSANSAINPIGQGYTVSVPPSVGFSYVKLADPFGGAKVITAAARSDGKPINVNNAWLSSTYLPDVKLWKYYLNIFDSNNTAGLSYILAFGNPPIVNRAPVIQQLPDRVARVGGTVGFMVRATDADGDPITLSASSIPLGATFVNTGAGLGAFSWTPSAGQTGDYPVQFSASDGKLADRKSAIVTVTSGTLHGAWKKRYWPGVTDLAIIGDGADPDGDESSNALEYATGSDPTNADDSAEPEVQIEAINGLHYLTMTYRQRTDDPSLICTVAGSDSLKTPKVNWTLLTIAVPVNQNDLPDGFVRKKMRDSVAVEGGSSKRFLELRVGRSQ